MARFLFKDIEFPNAAQYSKAQEILRANNLDYLPGGTPNQQKTSVLQAGGFGENSRQSKLSGLRREEQEYAKRDFNPINSLIKTDSTSRLIEKHKDSLKKLHTLHS